MSYRYKGKETAPESDLCGTDSGYRKHIRAGAAPCRACKAAHAAAFRDWQARRNIRMRTQCGTYPGYMRHKRAEGEACDLCKAAYAEYMRQYRARKQVAA